MSDSRDLLSHNSELWKLHNPQIPLPTPSKKKTQVIKSGTLIAYPDSSYPSPQTEWIIDGMIAERTHVVLFGPSGGYKSFLAVDIACHIANARNFHGRAIKGGGVLYIAAEGESEIKRRIDGWKEHHGCSGDVYIVPRDVQLRDKDLMGNLTEIAKKCNQPLRLIVFDTLARCAVGVKEKEADEINEFINAPVQALIRSTGATVLLVHHTGYNQSHERGSTAYRDAADTSIRVNARSNNISVECAKMRSAEPFKSLRFDAVPSRGSLILQAVKSVPSTKQLEVQATSESTAPIKAKQPRKGKSRVTNAQKLMDIVEKHPNQFSKATLREQSGMSDSSFYDAFNKIESRLSAGLDGTLGLIAT